MATFLLTTKNKVMQNKEITGIDFSKKTFDVFLLSNGEHIIFRNTATGFKQFLKWLQQRLKDNFQYAHVVMEHTGIYSYLFECFMHKHQISFSKVAAVKIKKSAGLIRGKSDKNDAKMIAKYGWDKQLELKLQSTPNSVVLELKNILSLRDKMVRDRAGYIARLKEQTEFLDLSKNDILVTTQKDILKAFDKGIEELKARISTIINKNEALAQNFKLLTSIKGIGVITATYMIAFTENFTAFDTWRQFACYSGTAPFPYESGISVKGKTKVSVYAYKKIKTILHLAALSAVRFNPEIKEYYDRRTAIGKNKMSTLNVVRGKLLSRMFAVVARQSEYKIEWLQAA
jgi:transposase